MRRHVNRWLVAVALSLGALAGCGGENGDGPGPDPSPTPDPGTISFNCRSGCPQAGSTLASNLAIALGTAADADSVYVGDSAGRLRRICKGGGTNEVIASVPGGVVYCVAVDGATVYFGTVQHGTEQNGGGGSVRAVGKTGGGVGILASGFDWVVDIAVDATHLYWLSRGTYATPERQRPDGRLFRMPKGGGAAELLARDLGAPIALALDATEVYFTLAGDTEPPAPAGFGVRRISKSGGAAATVNARQPAGHMALDAAFVYFTEPRASGGVYRVPKSGGAPDRVYATGLRFPLDIAVSGEKLYFVADNSDSGSVQSVGLQGGTPSVLRAGLNLPSILTLDECAVYVSTNRTIEVLPR